MDLGKEHLQFFFGLLIPSEFINGMIVASGWRGTNTHHAFRQIK